LAVSFGIGVPPHSLSLTKLFEKLADNIPQPTPLPTREINVFCLCYLCDIAVAQNKPLPERHEKGSVE
jgi:hypothetical protein